MVLRWACRRWAVSRGLPPQAMYASRVPQQLAPALVVVGHQGAQGVLVEAAQLLRGGDGGRGGGRRPGSRSRPPYGGPPGGGRWPGPVTPRGRPGGRPPGAGRGGRCRRRREASPSPPASRAARMAWAVPAAPSTASAETPGTRSTVRRSSRTALRARGSSGVSPWAPGCFPGGPRRASGRLGAQGLGQALGGLWGDGPLRLQDEDAVRGGGGVAQLPGPGGQLAGVIEAPGEPVAHQAGGGVTLGLGDGAGAEGLDGGGQARPGQGQAGLLVGGPGANHQGEVAGQLPPGGEGDDQA